MDNLNPFDCFSDESSIELVRVGLFVFEWIWTTVAAFIFPDKLIGSEDSVGSVCFFDRQPELSRCRYGLAWGTIAWLVLTMTIIAYLLDFCSRVGLTRRAEIVIFAWLTLWWVSYPALWLRF